MKHSLLFVVLSSESLSIIAITLSSNFRNHSQASRCFTADVCLRQSVNQLYNNQKWPNLFFFPLLDHSRLLGCCSVVAAVVAAVVVVGAGADQRVLEAIV